MKKGWKIFGTLALVCLILGVVLIGAGFFTGGSPVTIENHGGFTEYAARLQMNWNILSQQTQALLTSFGF